MCCGEFLTKNNMVLDRGDLQLMRLRKWSNRWVWLKHIVTTSSIRFDYTKKKEKTLSNLRSDATFSMYCKFVLISQAIFCGYWRTIKSTALCSLSLSMFNERPCSLRVTSRARYGSPVIYLYNLDSSAFSLSVQIQLNCGANDYYYYFFSNADSSVLLLFSHIAKDPAETDLHTRVKNCIFTAFEETEETQLERVENLLKG